MDWLPTLAALTGANLPTDRKLDGVDVWSIISADTAESGPRDEFLYFRSLELQAIRQGPFKLRLAQDELYNLEADIGETKNVAAAHPDIVERLKQRAAEVDLDLGRTGIGPGCRELGRVADARPLISTD